MSTIYLDHNVISDIAGIPGSVNGPQGRQQIESLLHLGFKFVLSAWNMYELARSNNQQHVDQCCAFVEGLNPAWMSDTTKVKRQEVDRFLQPVFDNLGPVRNREFSPFNSSVYDMWTTFGEAGRRDETFTSSVELLRARPEFLELIERSAKKTPEAILIGRTAYQLGYAHLLDRTISEDYFKLLLPPGADRKQLCYLIENQDQLLATSPALAVENAIEKLRIRDSFNPKSSHAADLQHVIATLGYCDYFVTADRQLAQHSSTVTQKLNLQCRVCRNVSDIVS